jgi:integrase/recombinase XerD
MTETVTVHPQTHAWLRLSALQAHVPEYCAYLNRQGYARNTKRVYLCSVAHFSRWVSSERIRVATVDEHVIERFICGHLTGCACPYPARRSTHEIRAALKHLLIVLRMSGAIPERRQAQNRIEAELLLFREYMMSTCGLAFNTCSQRVRIVRRFLIQRFGSGSIVAKRITPEDLRDFVLGESEPRSAGSLGVMAGALRCYFRFRAMSGDRVQHLIESAPRVAHWRLATVPESLTESEIRQFLDSFRQLTCSPKRAYAMVRCLTDLGLRASEVALLRLEDVDWRTGTIRLAANKSRRVDVLPLPAETGTAIAEYLRAERPETTNRALFVRHVAPRHKPIGPGVVRRVVKEAYQRCGWTRSRVHILRHSIASRLLRAGSPLKEIADVLRHRSLDTSMIYTKVDVNRLAAVALPWSRRSL